MAERAIIIKSGDQYEGWQSVKEMCKNHPEFSYNYMKRLKFPFTYKGYDFIRVPWREKNDKL